MNTLYIPLSIFGRINLFTVSLLRLYCGLGKEIDTSVQTKPGLDTAVTESHLFFVSLMYL